jgi:hypothetical protein
MRTPPGSTVSHHGVEDHQQLPHARHQRHLLLGLAGLNESFVELLDGGIEAGGDQGSHVECFSNPCPAAPYGASASQSAGVAVERSDPYEGREFSGRKGAELGQLRQERPAKHGAHSGNAPEKSFVRLEGGAAFDDLVEVAVRARKLLLEPPYVGFDASADGFGGARSETVFLGGCHLDDLPSSGEDLLELPGFLVGDGPRDGADGLSEVGENESVQGVGLGQSTGGFGEVPRLAGVDHEEGDPGGGQGRGEGALEASAGLQDHKKGVRDDDLCKPAQKLLYSRLVVGNYEVLSDREDGDIQGSLGDIYPHVGSSAGAQGGSPFPPAPSLAGTSSGNDSSPAQATVRAPPEGSVGARRSWLSHGLQSEARDQGVFDLPHPYQPIVDKNQNTRSMGIGLADFISQRPTLSPLLAMVRVELSPGPNGGGVKSA